MSGAQYNVTFCQVLQSERLIKISAFLKLFSSSTPGECSISLKEFLKSFSISEESSDDNIVDLDSYNRVFNEEETPIILDTRVVNQIKSNTVDPR